jgi:hypothetical protein
LLATSGGNLLKDVSQGVRGRRVAFSGAADIDMMRDVFNDMLTRIELNEQALEQMVADIQLCKPPPNGKKAYLCRSVSISGFTKCSG